MHSEVFSETWETYPRTPATGKEPIPAGELVPLVVKDFLQQVAAMDATSPQNCGQVKPHPKPLRITLDPEQSEILADAGSDAFLVIGKGSYPHSAGRWELWVVPSNVKAIDSAVGVVRGTHRAVRIKAPKP